MLALECGFSSKKIYSPFTLFDVADLFFSTLAIRLITLLNKVFTEYKFCFFSINTISSQFKAAWTYCWSFWGGSDRRYSTARAIASGTIEKKLANSLMRNDHVKDLIYPVEESASVRQLDDSRSRQRCKRLSRSDHHHPARWWKSLN